MMFRACRFASETSRAVAVGRAGARFLSFARVKEAFKGLLGMGPAKSPYAHVCQIGDPVLRVRSMAIDPEVVRDADFQKVINHLINVMRSYEACGLAAPQIGLPWQVFAIEFTEKNLKMTDEAVRKALDMEIVPLKVFINPQLKITDFKPILFHEGCESIRGFSAVVPRAYEVEITALNTFAEQFTWRARGWPARIAQHEYDHLQGKLYVDKMDASTFYFTAWEQINNKGGQVHQKYGPRR